MDTVAMIRLAHEGDKAARDTIVNENMGLVWSVVRRFLGRGYEAEDLFQIGCIGLIKAIDKFDNNYEVQFSTYAVPMIMGEIKRFLRDDGMIKVSRSLKENGWKIKQMSDKLSQKYGRDATLNEVADALELSVEEVVMALDANIEVESLYKSVYQSDGNELYLVDKVADKNENTYNEIINHVLIEDMLKQLDEVQKKLINLRYYQDKTQTEVAKILGISQVQVSRMEKKLLLKMRNSIC
ncbi:MAG: RNA polymerase sporulation sigma factor SigF [Lachnospiraceae bacterium]|nr:RNA polymerase sporulation sigma factor SigF [Lachnospiraceae bacterium]MBQ4067793.1 RNA polymerase sporulation sigma factor SigF [Lachnospiraceae bacterium]